jgi:hypothetical protein
MANNRGEQSNYRLNLVIATFDELLAEHSARIAAMASNGPYREPAAIHGLVTRGDNGSLKCDDRAIQGILNYVQAKYPDEAKKVDLSGQAHELHFPLDTAILRNVKKFAEGCKANGIDLTTYSTRQAITKGVAGFGASARLQVSTDSPTANAQPSTQIADMSPFAFLQGVKYQAETSAHGLRDLVNKCLNSPDPVTLELRGRLGAQAINHVIDTKRFSKEIGYAMVASVVVSGGVAFALDYYAWSAAVRAIALRLGAEHSATKFADVMLSSLTPLAAETIDSLIVKRLLGTFKHEPLLPGSFKEFLDDLKDSLKAGAIAAAGSVPGNALALVEGRWGLTLASALGTNPIATATSGAMVPSEVAKSHAQMAAGVLQQIESGFFPKPQLSVQDGTSDAETLVRHVKSDTHDALKVAPGDGLAINSMGIGSILSLMANAPLDLAVRMGSLDRKVQKIVAIAVNTPTEILSLGTGILTGMYLGGAGALMTTDREKNSRMVELIANKAIERLNGGESQPSIEITKAELDAIQHPKLELSFGLGNGIVGAMNGVVDLLVNLFKPATREEQDHVADLNRTMPGSYIEEIDDDPVIFRDVNTDSELVQAIREDVLNGNKLLSMLEEGRLPASD